MASENGREELVARATAGERAALEALLGRYLPRLRAYVRTRLSPELRQQESSSDLVQSVCRELLDHAGSFRFEGEDKFRSWLFVTALNKIRERIRFYRAERRTPARETPADSAVELADGYAELHSPSKVASAHELAQKMEAALDRLGEDDREVITLSRIVGLSHAEIARHLEKSEGAVRVMLSRALARLLAEIDGEE